LIDDVEVTGLAGACPAPTNFAAPTTTIACDNMDVTWTPASGSIMSGILWDVAGFDPTLGGNLIANAQTPQNIAGLTPGTAYDFYLVDSCSAGVSAPVFLTASTVSAPLPTISFTQSQTSTTSIDAVVNLDASASTNYTSVTWVFGDGTPNGTNAIENHTYTQNQAFTVTLTLVNGCGSVDSTFVVNVTGIGIEETELSRTLNIFPNPTDGAFTVNFSVDQSTEVSIRVLDALGRSVIVREMGTVSGEQMIALDLSNNASGIYMVQIVTDKGTITKRLTLRNK
jgi:PKD repeat protein